MWKSTKPTYEHCYENVYNIPILNVLVHNKWLGLWSMIKIYKQVRSLFAFY